MSIKLIALDLDGTLMLPDHITVSERNLKALNNAHKMGVRIAISTGRTLSIVRRVIEQIPFIDYVICSDGAVVYDVKNDKKIFEKLIDFDITESIITHVNSYDVFYNLYIDGKIVTQEGKQRFFTNTSLPQTFINDYINNTTVCDDILSSTGGVGAELIVCFFNSEEELSKGLEFVTQFNDKLSITSAFPGEFEMTSIEATKGKAIEYLCSLNGIDISQSLAVGDSSNDISMLTAAGVSVAMGNAEAKVKNIADFVTETNANDGVAKAIEKYVLGLI